MQNAFKSKPVVLSAPIDTDLDISLSNADSLASDIYDNETKATVLNESNNLTSLERVELIQAINMANLDDLDFSDEEIKEFKATLSAAVENPLVSKEIINQITLALRTSVSFLNAPRYEYIKDINKEDAIDFEKETLKTEIPLVSNEILETNSAQKNLINMLNAPRNEYIKDQTENVELIDAFLDTIDTQTHLQSSEMDEEIGSAEKTKANLLNAPESNYLEDSNLESVKEFQETPRGEVPLVFDEIKSEINSTGPETSKLNLLNRPRVEDYQDSNLERADSFNISKNYSEKVEQIEQEEEANKTVSIRSPLRLYMKEEQKYSIKQKRTRQIWTNRM